MRLIQLATVVLTMALGSALHADSADDEELDPSSLRIWGPQRSRRAGAVGDWPCSGVSVIGGQFDWRLICRI